MTPNVTTPEVGVTPGATTHRAVLPPVRGASLGNALDVWMNDGETS
ncbi:hypothetical protein [Pyxidicoccus sp. MSG2]|nr:hypothetical protein [Pyxidicoccus sp. MSG2]MCY1021129.1 hypothetical protein [Pyxidicoccus sp. MSG2]